MIWFTNMHVHVVGLIPAFLSEEDPRPAKEQIHENYAHGGGWWSFSGFKLHDWEQEGRAYLKYPEDPPMRELSRAKLRDETLILFEGQWLAIVQPDGSHEIARLD